MLYRNAFKEKQIINNKIRREIENYSLDFKIKRISLSKNWS